MNRLLITSSAWMFSSMSERKRRHGNENSTVQSSSRILSVAVRKGLDLGMYAMAMAGTIFVGLTVVSFALGGGWGGVKVLLFVVGFLYFGAASFQLRPRPSWKEGTGERAATVQSYEETLFERTVWKVLPLDPDALGVNDGDRVSPAAKLFIGSLVTLLLSYLMGTWLGIGA